MNFVIPIVCLLFSLVIIGICLIATDDTARANGLAEAQCGITAVATNRCAAPQTSR